MRKTKDFDRATGEKVSEKGQSGQNGERNE